jgi:hypothetical protein
LEVCLESLSAHPKTHGTIRFVKFGGFTCQIYNYTLQRTIPPRSWSDHASTLSRPMSYRVAPANHLQAVPAINLRVSPNLVSSSTPVGESSGCPESSLLQEHLSMSLRVTPDSASSGCAKVEIPSLPRNPFLWRRRRPIFELPRISCPSARLASNLQVALNSRLKLRL